MTSTVTIGHNTKEKEINSGYTPHNTYTSTEHPMEGVGPRLHCVGKAVSVFERWDRQGPVSSPPLGHLPNVLVSRLLTYCSIAFPLSFSENRASVRLRISLSGSAEGFNELNVCTTVFIPP